MLTHNEILRQLYVFHLSGDGDSKYHVSENEMSWFKAESFCHEFATKNDLKTVRLLKEDAETLLTEQKIASSVTYWIQLSSLKSPEYSGI